MNEMSTHPDDAVERKVARARRGLLGFMVSLAGGVTSLALQAPLALIGGLLGRGHDALSAALGCLTGFFLFAGFVSFALLLSALFMAPRETDIRPRLEGTLPLLVRIMLGAMAAFFTLVLGVMIVVMVVQLRSTGNPLFAAVAFLCVAVIVFAAGVGYALLRTVGAPGAVRTLRARIADAVVSRGRDGGRRWSVLGALEWGLGALLSAAVTLLVGWEDVLSALRPFIGGARTDAAERILTGADGVLYLFSFVIMLFAAAFTVKGLRIMAQTRRGVIQ